LCLVIKGGRSLLHDSTGGDFPQCINDSTRSREKARRNGAGELNTSSRKRHKICDKKDAKSCTWYLITGYRYT